MPVSPLLKSFVFALVAIFLSLLQAGLFRQEIVNVGGLNSLWQFIRASLRPDLSSEIVAVTLNATGVTLAYAVCGTFLSVVLGAIAGLFCSELWWTEILKVKAGFTIVRAILAFARAIHELIWGLFFVNIWGIDPVVAIVAIAIPFGAITAKVFSEILDETPRQALRTLINSGVSPITAFFYSLLPQAFLNLLSYAFYRFECSIRSAAVLGIIGAGGLGYEIFLSLQSLKYDQLWTFFYALIFLNGLVDFASAKLRSQFGCATRLDLNLHRQSTNSQKFSFRTLCFLFPVPCSLILFSFWYVHPDFTRLWAPRAQRLLSELVQSSLPPNFEGISSLIPLSIETIAMSVLAIALAALGGLLLAFPAAQNSLIARAILLFCRAIPAPIWALVVLYVMFPGILPGAIGLGLHNLGILGRLFTEVIENLEQPPLEALKSQGTPKALVFLYGVLPLTVPRFLAYTLYRWEVCMRETVIVGLVGAGGLGRSLTEQLSSFDSRSLIVTLGTFFLLTFLVDWISAKMRRSLR
jgi:phosphonate transport system permease protein